MFTVYLIKRGLGVCVGDTRICTHVNLMLLGCQILEKLFYEKHLIKTMNYKSRLLIRDTIPNTTRKRRIAYIALKISFIYDYI